MWGTITGLWVTVGKALSWESLRQDAENPTWTAFGVLSLTDRVGCRDCGVDVTSSLALAWVLQALE